jgi:hypothetical protein
LINQISWLTPYIREILSGIIPFFLFKSSKGDGFKLVTKLLLPLPYIGVTIAWFGYCFSNRHPQAGAWGRVKDTSFRFASQIEYLLDF